MRLQGRANITGSPHLPLFELPGRRTRPRLAGRGQATTRRRYLACRKSWRARSQSSASRPRPPSDRTRAGSGTRGRPAATRPSLSAGSGRAVQRQGPYHSCERLLAFGMLLVQACCLLIRAAGREAIAASPVSRNIFSVWPLLEFSAPNI